MPAAHRPTEPLRDQPVRLVSRTARAPTLIHAPNRRAWPSPGMGPGSPGHVRYRAAREMTITRDVAATRQRVWEVLADGWSYSGWVVGNSRIRAVSPDWPAPGTRILHSIGTWPAVINDETVVERCIPGEELVLLAKVGPRPRRESRCS